MLSDGNTMRVNAIFRCALLAYAAIHALSPSAQESADQEGFIRPSVDMHRIPEFPSDAREQSITGWVYLRYMVDPSGRAQDVILVDSSGVEAFEAAAVHAVQQTDFFPATMDGIPITARASQFVEFTVEGSTLGPSPRFFEKYGILQQQISNGKRQAAVRSLGRLRQTSKTRFENSWLEIAAYLLSKRWGTKQNQLDALNRATAYMSTNKHLPADTYTSAMVSKILLEIDLKYFKAAQGTLNKIRREDSVDADILRELQSYEKQIEEVKSDQRPFSVRYEFDTARVWVYDLLWNRFHIHPIRGDISSLTVMCDRAVEHLRLEHGLDHEVAGDVGDCSVYVRGNPGDEILLSQRKTPTR